MTETIGGRSFKTLVAIAMYITKESRAGTDGVLRTNADPSEVIKVASVDTAVNGSTFTTADGKTVGTKYVTEARALSSALPDAAFKQLRQFEVLAPSGAYVSLMVGLCTLN